MINLLQYDFCNALVAVVIIAVASAVIGTYIVTRRLVAISGGITHACFGGLGLGYYFGLSPVAMAAAVAVVSGLAVEWMSGRGRMREDSAIAVIWSLGMAAGVIFVFLTPVMCLSSIPFCLAISADGGPVGSAGFRSLCRGADSVLCILQEDSGGMCFRPRLRASDPSAGRADQLCHDGVYRRRYSAHYTSCRYHVADVDAHPPQLTAEVYARRFDGILLLSAVVSVVCGVGGLMLATVIDVPCSALIVLLQAAVYFAARCFRALVWR